MFNSPTFYEKNVDKLLIVHHWSTICVCVCVCLCVCVCVYVCNLFVWLLAWMQTHIWHSALGQDAWSAPGHGFQPHWGSRSTGKGKERWIKTHTKISTQKIVYILLCMCTLISSLSVLASSDYCISIFSFSYNTSNVTLFIQSLGKEEIEGNRLFTENILFVVNTYDNFNFVVNWF